MVAATVANMLQTTITADISSSSHRPVNPEVMATATAATIGLMTDLTAIRIEDQIMPAATHQSSSSGREKCPATDAFGSASSSNIAAGEALTTAVTLAMALQETGRRTEGLVAALINDSCQHGVTQIDAESAAGRATTIRRHHLAMGLA